MEIMRGINSRTSALRLNAQRSAERKRIQHQFETTDAARQKLLSQIGQAYLDSRGSEDTTRLYSLCSSFDQVMEDLKHLTERMEQLNGRTHCPACGRERRQGDVFCPACGQKLENMSFSQADAPSSAPEPPAEPTVSPIRRVYINWPEQNAEAASRE